MSLFQPDLVLLHAPSVYDFRKKALMPGPISDVIPSTPIFEMYPVGFISISEFLKRKGYKVRIINLAYLMLKDKKFEVESYLSKLQTKAFGIDLHWLPHAHGSLEVARICKVLHPKIPIIFGGYSATYFHEELMNYPQVDFVIRGDSTEEAIYKLLLSLEGKIPLTEVPNLTYREGKCIKINPLTLVAQDLNGPSNDYLGLFKTALISMNIKGFTAIHDWWEYPITAVMTCRGCTHNCIICGGSKQALHLYCSREKVAFRDPGLVVEDIAKISRYTEAPIFVVGDLRQAGDEYAHLIFKGIKKICPKNQIVLELFQPAPKDYFMEAARSIPNLNFEFSPESHDQTIREACGKFYTNKEMEDSIQAAIDCGCKKFDIFFMIGLPKQTYHSVMENIEYCDYLFYLYKKKIRPFISPLAPFLDPGSIAYEQSERFGYKIFYQKLEEYRQALLAPSWKYTLSYETEWMNRDEIVRCTYEAALKLNQIKWNHGIISESDYRLIESRIKAAIKLLNDIDDIVRNSKGNNKEEQLMKLKLNLEKDAFSTLCVPSEIKWPLGRKRLKYFNIIKDLILG